MFTFYGPLAAGAIIDLAASVIFKGEALGDYAGFSLSSGADANNDTFEDLLVGALNADSPAGTTDVGKVYLIYGNATLSPVISLAAANASWFVVTSLTNALT